MTSQGKSMLKSQKDGQSASLWNICISSGWSTLEMNMLKVGVMKFGIGKWTALHNSQILPGKPIQLCYL